MNPRSLIGYAVSHDGGTTFVDMGGAPPTPTVQPVSDPSLAMDDEGNAWLAMIASDRTVLPRIFKLALYEMPAGTDTFQLVSTPVVAPQGIENLPDKELLAVGRDGQGRRHLYITYTQYGPSSPGLIQGPVTLLDSTDAVTWRRTTLTESDLCEPATPAATPVPAGGTLYVFFNDIDHAACANDPDVDLTVASGRQEVIAVDVQTATILRRTVIARIHGNGEHVRTGSSRR